MKKINLMIIAILAGAMAFMTSCDNGNEPATAKPVIEFTSDNTQTYQIGDTATIVGNVTAEGSLSKITFFKGDATFGDPITKDFNTKTTHTFSVKVAADTTFDFEVQVEDKDGQISKKSVTINVRNPLQVVKTTGLKMYCAQAGIYGNGDYASLTTFETWNHSQGSAHVANIDVWYYNGNYTKDLGGHPHLVSPDTKTTEIVTHGGNILTNAKATKLLVLTDASAFDDFSTIEDDASIYAIDMSNATSNVGDFSEGDVIAFKLADGKMGVMKAVGGTAGFNSDDYILVDVIVQGDAPITK